MLRIYVAKPRGEGGREHFPLVAAKTHRRDRGPPPCRWSEQSCEQASPFERLMGLLQPCQMSMRTPWHRGYIGI